MINLIPTPNDIQMSGERVALAPLCSAPKAFANATTTLRDYALRAHSIEISEGKGAIEFELASLASLTGAADASPARRSRSRRSSA